MTEQIVGNKIIWRILHAALLLPVLFAAACTTTSNDKNTVSGLEQARVVIKDEKVDAGLDKTMASYRKYLQQATTSKQHAENTRRPTDLEAETSYSIPGVQTPAQPGARAAIKHYTQLLASYPMHDNNDQVLYQLSRAYKEAGKDQKAAAALQTLASRYPDFTHIDEVNFRLGEYYFRTKKYKQASQSYSAVLASGKTSVYYPLTLNKLGWSYFKLDDYKKALDYFILSLEHIMVQTRADKKIADLSNNKQLADSYHAVSLSFSYLGGADAITAYLKTTGHKDYEAELYQQLALYYLSKKHYSDAARSYQAYIDVYPLDEKAPYHAKRIIEVYQQGGFIELSIKARKQFSKTYDRRADYWEKNRLEKQPEIDKFQKDNIRNLASHYHADYKKLHNEKTQNKQQKQAAFTEAAHWYKQYSYLYPLDQQTPAMSKLLAELFLEQRDYRSAARAFERTAYNYPDSDIAAQSGYSAIFSYREHLKTVASDKRRTIREDIVQSSIFFVETFPQHAQASAVLTTAASDQLLLKNYTAAANTARRVIRHYPQADKKQLRSAWLILADASFESAHYADAEKAYRQTLSMTKTNDKKRPALVENLAAAIYKQGERAKSHGKHAIAAQHFQRIATNTPNASLGTSAQFDAAAEFIATENWSQAGSVLENFRKHNTDNKLSEVATRNLAVIYKMNGQYLNAAIEFERIAKNNSNKAIQRDALLQAADSYRRIDKDKDALRVYQQYVKLFPSPAADAVKSYQHIADIYKSKNDENNYHKTLNKLIAADANTSSERTYQTRQLAADATLILAEDRMRAFNKVKLSKPFKKNLTLKKKHMNASLALFRRLLEYQISETTTAATFHIAEIYLQFSQDMAESERPTGLSELELEQYDLSLEEQVYVFEEKAISLHEKNTELLGAGIYDPWVTKSINRLSQLLPARYAKPEQHSDYLQTLFTEGSR